MANNIRSSGIRNDPGSEIDPLRSIIPVDSKSFVVGKYDEQGSRKAKGTIAGGGPEANRLNKLMVQSMRTRGGEVMPGFIMTPDGPVKASHFTPKIPIKIAPATKLIKGKKGRKVKIESEQNYLQEVEETINSNEPQYEIPQEQVKVETFSVTFNIESGTIKSSVDSILEDELGLILVYNNEDNISYVPKRGGKLSLTLPGHRNLQVMYLGIKLQWYNSSQQLLLFVKTEIKE